MKKFKVLYLINYAPNYRDKFLVELGKYVDLTVTSFPGSEANLKDPAVRTGYRYIPLQRKKLLGINYNSNEYSIASGDFDVIIVGYTLWNPFRMINLFRRKKRVICEGLIYGRNNDMFTRLLRKLFINAGEGILVYSEMVREKLANETEKPIIVFNNTSYSRSEVEPIPLNPVINHVNVVWVGRYQERKKIERLYELAKADSRVNVRLIGPGIRSAFEKFPAIPNLEIFDAAYEQELYEHFKWSHLVLNPGGAGLLVMNSARFARAIVIDINSHHGPEIQLAKDAGQDFIDFSKPEIVIEYINKIFDDPFDLHVKAQRLCKVMQENYTIEFMAKQYMKAIKGEWQNDTKTK